MSKVAIRKEFIMHGFSITFSRFVHLPEHQKIISGSQFACIDIEYQNGKGGLITIVLYNIYVCSDVLLTHNAVYIHFK